jgi:hypothetical protein
MRVHHHERVQSRAAFVVGINAREVGVDEILARYPPLLQSATQLCNICLNDIEAGHWMTILSGFQSALT